MDFALPRVHHSEVTLAVNNLPLQRDPRNIDCGYARTRPDRLQTPWFHFPHHHPVSRNACSLQPHPPALIRGSFPESMFSRSHQQHGHFRGLREQHWIWPANQRPFNHSVLVILKQRVGKRVLRQHQHESHSAGNTKQRGNHAPQPPAHIRRRFRQIPNVEICA